jgi:hypothetical protein
MFFGDSLRLQFQATAKSSTIQSSLAKQSTIATIVLCRKGTTTRAYMTLSINILMLGFNNKQQSA